MPYDANAQKVSTSAKSVSNTSFVLRDSFPIASQVLGSAVVSYFDLLYVQFYFKERKRHFFYLKFYYYFFLCLFSLVGGAVAVLERRKGDLIF